MSKEYLNADAVMEAFCNHSEVIMHNGKPSFAVNYPNVVRSIPPADVKPVARGKWTYGDGETLWTCSVCGNDSCCKGNYCPNCGAEMRKEVKDGEQI